MYVTDISLDSNTSMPSIALSLRCSICKIVALRVSNARGYQKRRHAQFDALCETLLARKLAVANVAYTVSAPSSARALMTACWYR
jgi:hypothetical protein